MDSMDFKINSINTIGIKKANGDIVEGIIEFYPSEGVICTITIPDILGVKKNESINSL